MKKLETIYLDIDEQNIQDGIDAISLVKFPAIEESTPSNTLLLFLAHKIQQRVTKKVESFDSWKSKVTDITASDFETANFTKPEASGE